MTLLFYLWIVLAALFFIIIGDGKKGGALSMAYFFGLSLIHVPGLYVNTSKVNGLQYNLETENGFTYTVFGITSLLIGFWLSLKFSKEKPTKNLNSYDYLKQSQYLIIFGIIVFTVLIPIVYIIPSLTSIVSPLNGLLMIGFWYLFYYAKISNQRKYIWLGLFCLPLLPILTMVTGGFMGFGVYWILTIISFLYILYKKWIFIILSPLIAILGVSFSVAYFENRDALRENVWLNQSSYSDRFDVIFSMVENFKILDKDDFEQAKLVDDRLNQNHLLGLAIYERESGKTKMANGSTVPLWVFIPRIIWPDKPTVGGSNRIVSDYTGREFASGTSVGVGQPLEFYINFGVLGIIFGYLLFGFLLMRIDLNLTYNLKTGNLKGVLLNGLIGISLLQPGGSLMEILVSVIGSLVLTPFIARQLHLAGWIQNIILKPIKIKNQVLLNKK